MMGLIINILAGIGIYYILLSTYNFFLGRKIKKELDKIEKANRKMFKKLNPQNKEK